MGKVAQCGTTADPNCVGPQDTMVVEDEDEEEEREDGFQGRVGDARQICETLSK